MMKNAKMEFSQLDKEWVELILEAQKANISLEEIRKYLLSHKSLLNISRQPEVIP